MAETTSNSADAIRMPVPVGPNTRNYALVGLAFGALFPITSGILMIALQRLPFTLANWIAVQHGNPLMWVIDSAPLVLGAVATMAGLRQDALAERTGRIAERERELTTLKTSLEDRVLERTEQLETRNLQMRAAVEMTRQIAALRDAPALAATAVTLLAENFPGVESDVYLLDSRGGTAIVQASSPGAGANRPKPGSVVVVGDTSIVGQVAAQGTTYLSPPIAPTGEAPGAEPPADQPHLQITLPLVSRARILGVLDIHGTARGFTQADTDAFHLLADLLAAALDNARLLDETRVSLEQLEQASGERTRAAWQEYLKQRNMAYQYTPRGIRGVAEGIHAQPGRDLIAPLAIRGQQIGSISIKREAAEGWSDVDRDLAQKVAAQVALALENNRLLEETRDRATYEQRISAISDRLSQSVDIDGLLQTAARELAALPEVSDASVVLNPDLKVR